MSNTRKANATPSLLRSSRRTTHELVVRMRCTIKPRFTFRLATLLLLGLSARRYTAGQQQEEFQVIDSARILRSIVPWDDSCPQCITRPSAMTFVYQGGPCEQSQNGQAFTFSCLDSTSHGPPPKSGSAAITVKSARSSEYFSGTVQVGRPFTIRSSNGFLDSELRVEIFRSGSSAALMQSIMFHSSCSQQLGISDIFGSVQVIEIVTDMGTLSLADCEGATPAMPTPSPVVGARTCPAADACDEGKFTMHRNGRFGGGGGGGGGTCREKCVNEMAVLVNKMLQFRCGACTT